MSPYHYLKDSPVDGIVVTFTAQHESHGILIIKYRQINKLSSRQQLKAISNLLTIVVAFMAHARSDDYFRISARSYLKLIGAGASAKPLKPPLILGFSGALQFIWMEGLMEFEIGIQLIRKHL